MLSQINRLITRFENLSLRERGLVLLVIMGLIYVIWDFLLMQPLEEQRLHLLSLLQYKQKHLNTLNQTLQELKNPSSLEPDNNNTINNTINKLRKQLLYQENDIKFLTSTLISPQNMLRMLKSVLTQQTSLTLLKLETQISQPLSEINPSTKVFKHSLHLEFSGNYKDILTYIRFLEDLPWKFYWDELDIVINNYPSTHITLTVYTFSRKIGWTAKTEALDSKYIKLRLD
jgi:MSHA biogenesis protein MshJ